LSLGKSLSIFFCAYLLLGCTSLGAHFISNPGVYISETALLDVSPESKGFNKQTLCLPHESVCVPYLIVAPYNPSDFKGNKAVFYNLHAGGNGIVNEISHRTVF